MSTFEQTAKATASRPLVGKLSAGQLTVFSCAIPIVMLVAAAWYKRWVTDDAFIDLRVVANIQHGFGPVWNPGERVEVFTSPAWIAILWIFSSVLRFVALEWVAVLLGIACTVVGLVAAARGAALLWRAAGKTSVALPLGLVVIVALRPMWDFTTSGLETGLTFAWLGGSFWMLAVLHTRPARARREGRRKWFVPHLTAGGAALLVGIGPLVRPDLGIFSLGFLLALVIGPLAPARLAKLRLVVIAVALPIAYEIFRMGYFAALEPNTALAKEAGAADWSRGWGYLTDFVHPYYLFLPVLAVAALAAYELRGVIAPPRRVLWVALCPVACAAVHTLYIVRVGGDFMHGRMLLPSLFGALLPVAVVCPSRRRLSVGLGVAIVAWAAVSIVTLRAPYANEVTGGPVGDERAYYASLSNNPHPVTLRDYRNFYWARSGRDLKALASHGRALVLIVPMFSTGLTVNGQPAATVSSRVVAGAGAVGILGYGAGPQVHIADQLGLGDPLASRVRLAAIRLPDGRSRTKRVRAGHDKYLPTEWIAARFGVPSSIRLPRGASPRWVASARRAMACAPIQHLLTAVDTPMTAHRFFANIGASFTLTKLRFSANPVVAAAELCRP